ncbi:protein CDV3 homolog isoform X4 [Myotis myotis]|uniref:protein CDV3 homolog isoform X4 n=1 Tax=Myotis myotis TaxID=51298 RepID=UPI00174CA88D|nr:protein CDV3 homolog isoform X4 [Myotis myotis]
MGSNSRSHDLVSKPVKEREKNHTATWRETLSCGLAVDFCIWLFLDEDEWKEFEQKEVDYSGLRVQAMQISEKEEDDSEKREDPGDNWEEGGGGGGGVEKSSGPWNKTAPVQAPPAPVVVTETPEPAMTSGVYRPPGARLTTTRKTPQGPPEIYSDTQFPSLQSTAKHVESRNRDKEMEKSFEVVRHKTRGRDEVSKNQALKLQLDNQYTVLENQTNSHTQYN